MTAMPWDEYLKFMVEVEKENVAENYRVGRAATGADEELNRDTRIGFEGLQSMMPTLLAAPEMLAALRSVRVEIGELDADDKGWRDMDAGEVDQILSGLWLKVDRAISNAEGE